MSKKKAGKFATVVIVLLLIYSVLAILDFCGVFVQGYYSGNGYAITLGTMGTVINSNGIISDSVTYRTVGTKIYFYDKSSGKQTVACILQNGVISVYKDGQTINVMYKDGDNTLDGTVKSFVDYIRIAVSPLSELMYSVYIWVKNLAINR